MRSEDFNNISNYNMTQTTNFSDEGEKDWKFLQKKKNEVDTQVKTMRMTLYINYNNLIIKIQLSSPHKYTHSE
jgi:hypothetical protein